ncbi:hypothetical protein KBY91_19145 [Streptomyces sp. RK23]|uniref:hypothetical protein n=1 Tax=unclassified Streptomyces TaxID=2593676 RepID=UPI001B385664|nr:MULTISPECIES: hypothetical protein [unclassified Streptomyces]MBQ0963467.1 hypothetical protein [Streptomyces sp. RK74B]MBQ1005523.1 hypothetical protein [Streptomyces sp. RK23]
MTPEHTAEIIALLREIRNEQRAGFIRLEFAIKALSPTQPDTSHTPPADDSSPELTDSERRILGFVAVNPGCKAHVIACSVGGRVQAAFGTLNSLISRGYLTVEREGSARAFYPVPGVIPEPEPAKGVRTIDFTNAEPPTDGQIWARQKRAEIESRRAKVERQAAKSHNAEELADKSGVELPESEGA